MDSKEVNPAILENDFSRVEIFNDTVARSDKLFLPRLVIAIIGTLFSFKNELFLKELVFLLNKINK